MIRNIDAMLDEVSNAITEIWNMILSEGGSKRKARKASGRIKK